MTSCPPTTTTTTSLSAFFFSSLCSHGGGCSAWKCAHLSQLACRAISQGQRLLFIQLPFFVLLPGQEDAGVLMMPGSYFYPASLLSVYYLYFIPCAVFFLYFLPFFSLSCLVFFTYTHFNLFPPVQLKG